MSKKSATVFFTFTKNRVTSVSKKTFSEKTYFWKQTQNQMSFKKNIVFEKNMFLCQKPKGFWQATQKMILILNFF